MADIDEDAVDRGPSSSKDAATYADQDISDETQDFRFLNSISLYIGPRLSS